MHNLDSPPMRVVVVVVVGENEGEKRINLRICVLGSVVNNNTTHHLSRFSLQTCASTDAHATDTHVSPCVYVRRSQSGAYRG